MNFKRKAIAIAAIVLTELLALFAAPQAASALSQQDATNLCTWFRPYQTGYVIQVVIITEHDVNCVSILGEGACLNYDVYWFGGWNGPYNTHQTPFPHPDCG